MKQTEYETKDYKKPLTFILKKSPALYVPNSLLGPLNWMIYHKASTSPPIYHKQKHGPVQLRSDIAFIIGFYR